MNFTILTLVKKDNALTMIFQKVGRALLENPQQYNELTSSVKSELIPELSKAGFKFPRKLSSEQQKAQNNAESAITSLQDMRNEIFDENGEIRRGNLFQEKLPGAIGARQLRDQRKNDRDVITRIRTGAALNQSEEKFYIRTGPSTTELSASQTQEYIKQRFKG